MGTIGWQTEKYLGGQNDALIGGLNSEISNRLTLIRRPGNPSYPSSATFKNILRYESFKLFGPAVETIDVMIDEGPGDLTNGALYEDLVAKNLIFTKSAGAGQSNMASVGNDLFFGNGVDQKKWLNSVTVWPGTATILSNAQYPFYSTYLFDSNGAQQQLIAAVLSITNVTIAADGTTVTLSITAGQTASTQVIAGTGTSGSPLFFQGLSTVTQLNGQTGYITGGLPGNTITVELTAAVAPHTSAADTGLGIILEGGTPTTGGSTPTWATVALTPATTWPYPANVLTHDGTALWVNRQNVSSGQVAGIWNWGIAAPTTAPVPQTSTGTAWATNTYFSLDGVVVDASFNIWGVKVAGVSGSGSTPLGGTPTSGGIAFSGGTQVTDNGVTWECIQAAAAGDHGTTNPGTTWTAGGAWSANFPFVIAGTPKCLFRIGPFEQPEIIKALASETNRTTGAYEDAYFYDTSSVSNPGIWTYDGTHNTGATGGTHVSTMNSLLFNAGSDTSVQPIQAFPLTQAGVLNPASATTPFAGANQRWSMAVLVDINIPQALIDAGGQVSINVNHDDGFYFGVNPSGGSAPNTSAGTVSLISGANVATGVGVTGLNAYPIIGGINQNGYVANDPYVVQFSAAGTYQFEFDFFQWENAQTFTVLMNGYPNTPVDVAGGASPLTMTVAPIFPASSTSPAPLYPNVTENITVTVNSGTVPTGGNFVWNNHGPISSMAWAKSITFTLADSTIVDTNGDGEAPYLPGITGTTQPVWTSSLNQLTADGSTLEWINTGSAGAAPTGTITTYNGGWRYSIALVNTLDDTVSNIGLVSASTGNFRGSSGIKFAAGSGLPSAAALAANPAYNQADYVAIFRTTDSTTVGIPPMFLIPGVNNTPEQWTIPLSEYLTNGYTDTTPDTGLDELIEAPINQQNTPPAEGAINLVQWVGKIFYSIGSTVYWTSGAAATGNGINGISPLNFDEQESFVKRMVPTAIGLLVFTVSDINLIQKDSAGNILPAVPYIPGRGISSYNAVDQCGTIIGMYTADKVFVTIDPGAGGFNHVSQPIGNLIRQTSGVGTTWNPADVYVAWHVNGEDAAWYLADGSTGWYRVCQTPSPETGYSWSPFAQIVGGVQAVQSIETAPGIHNLLLGPVGSTPRVTLNRDLDVFTDNTSPYNAFAQVGSIVFVHPGQVAEIAFIETDSVLIGTPLTLGVLFDEAVPYWTGPFETLKVWETDPTNQPQSKSILGQRFYTMDANLQNGAICRHMQIEIDWGIQSVQNEVATMTIFGALMQEQ